ncbi:MAG: hypothetical protein ACRC2T_19635 [Thermoguttaceae bacterium]
MFFLFAQTSNLLFRFARVQEPRDWFLPVVVTLLLIYWAYRRYSKDATDLSLWKRGFLFLLRVAAIITLLIFYLHPQWERLAGMSRVAILIDSSASMSSRELEETDKFEHFLPGMSEQISSGNIEGLESDENLSRVDVVNDWLRKSEIIEQLRKKHDVVVYKFDSNLVRLAAEKAESPFDTSDAEKSESNKSVDPSSDSEQSETPESTELSGAESTKLSESAYPSDSSESPEMKNEKQKAKGESAVSGNVIAGLVAEGTETRLGEAIRDLLQRERGLPLAGVILISDGGQNAGMSTDQAAELAKTTQIPIHAIGIGSKKQPINFRIVQFEVPERAFPSDPFTVKAVIEMQGELATPGGGNQTDPTESQAGQEKISYKMPVELRIATVSDSAEQTGVDKNDNSASTVSSDASKKLENGTLLETQEIEITPGAKREVEFEVKPDNIGKYRLQLSLTVPKEDFVPEDNTQSGVVEIVDRKDRVLLFAGGPLRDYQFLCNQLFRDKSVLVDVYLPWAAVGISQSADKILDSFPSDRAEMFEYDCVVAFDPDWRLLSPTQIDVLESWVARGGGMVVVAGPIFLADTITGWTSDPSMNKVRAMYPVEVSTQGLSSVLSYRTDSQPWQINFTRDGEAAEYLRPADSEVESRAIWSDFPGFYSFFIVKGVKPTAKLLAKSTSPDAAGSGGTAAIFAEQFYGAGRVFYIGSAELWRLRMVNDSYFEKIFTKIIRYVSQGRLQNKSQRGSLATDKKRYSLGTTASIRATAYDDQFRPCDMPTLSLDLIRPDSKVQKVQLQLDPNVPGTYSGFVPLLSEGNWTLKFHLPGTDEVLAETVQVRMSDLESENPSRNEPLLRSVATKTGGQYFNSVFDALLPKIDSDLVVSKNADPETGVETTILDLLPIRSQRAVLDTKAEEETMWIFLYVLCGLVCTEWFFRRLFRLA